MALLGHTHDLGTKVTGWIINKDQNQWKLLGSVDPQKPQFFHPLKNEKGQTITKRLKSKDILAVRCGFINSTPNTVVTGGSRKDEMFYTILQKSQMGTHIV